MNNMKKIVILLLAVGVMTGFTHAASKEGRPDATLRLSGGSLAAGIGFSWGKGTLTYKGKDYPVSVNGLSLGKVGISGASAYGASGASTARRSTSRPVATVDTSQRLRHIISFVDELTQTSRAKPAGMVGCEIWVKIGGSAPADPSELTYLATDTRSPYVAEFDGADAGKTAYYMLRWVNTRGERGPWSQTISGTITN